MTIEQPVGEIALEELATSGRASLRANDEARLGVIRDQLHPAVIGDCLDKIGCTRQFLPQGIRPIEPAMVVVGRAMPVLLADVFGEQHQPFGRLTEALDQLQPGEVYLARSGRVPCAAWGEILTATARYRGAVGAVLDGFHRDTRGVLAQNWPVFSCGAYAQDARVRSAVMDYRVTVQIGDVLVHPGDLVVGSVDGVVVVPAAIEDEVLEMALDKCLAEEKVKVAINEGLSSTDALRAYGVL